MFVTVRKVWQVVAPVPLDAQVVLVQACLAVAISTAACTRGYMVITDNLDVAGFNFNIDQLLVVVDNRMVLLS